MGRMPYLRVADIAACVMRPAPAPLWMTSLLCCLGKRGQCSPVIALKFANLHLTFLSKSTPVL